MKKIILCMCYLMVWLTPAVAAEPTPVGVWRTYDLEGIPRSLMKIYVANGELQGKVIKILPTKGKKPTDTCEKCPGPWRNKPMIGLVIMWGLKHDKGSSWKDGCVLDTDSGNIYRCQLSVSDDNQILHLRPYVASPLLGATVDWERVYN